MTEERESFTGITSAKEKVRFVLSSVCLMTEAIRVIYRLLQRQKFHLPLRTKTRYTTGEVRVRPNRNLH